jgi:hypothetical protein
MLWPARFVLVVVSSIPGCCSFFPSIVLNERQQLIKKNKEPLKKDSRELNVKVNCRVKAQVMMCPRN